MNQGFVYNPTKPRIYVQLRINKPMIISTERKTPEAPLGCACPLDDIIGTPTESPGRPAGGGGISVTTC